MVDLVSHVLWAYAVFNRQPDVWSYAVFSILPDLIWAIPSVGGILTSGQAREHFRNMRHFDRSERMKRIAGQPHFDLVRTLYHAAHSWLLMTVLGGMVWALKPELAAPFFGGVFLHLAMDLFLHKESPFGQHPFFPLSKFKVDGFIHWSDKRVLAANFALLAVAYLGIYLGGG